MTIRVENKKHFQGQGIYIGRPSVLGNPYTLEMYSREQSIALYREWLAIEYPKSLAVRRQINALLQLYERGEDVVLICWCKPLPCHGDVIVEFVLDLNAGTRPRIPDVVTGCVDPASGGKTSGGGSKPPRHERLCDFIDELIESDQFDWCLPTLEGIRQTVADNERASMGQIQAIVNIAETREFSVPDLE